jgi:hypothetical protein
MKMLQFLFLLLIAPHLQAQYVYNPFGFNAEEQKAVKKNKVKNIFVFDQEENAVDTSKHLMKTSFSSNGLPIQSSYRALNDEGEYQSDCNKYYLCSGRRGAITRETFECASSDETITVYTYSKKGVLSKREVITIDPTTYLYTENKGLIINCKGYTKFPAYNEEGEFEGKTIDVYNTYIEYSYSKKGQLQKETVYDVDDKGNMVVNNHTLYEYSENGFLLKCLTYSSVISEENKVNTTIYTYSKNGLLSKETNESAYDGYLNTYYYVYEFYK